MVGCLLDLAEHTMMVTLNGELLFTDRGSDLAAKDFDIGDGLSISPNIAHSSYVSLN